MREEREFFMIQCHYRGVEVVVLFMNVIISHHHHPVGHLVLFCHLSILFHFGLYLPFCCNVFL